MHPAGILVVHRGNALNVNGTSNKNDSETFSIAGVLDPLSYAVSTGLSGFFEGPTGFDMTLTVNSGDAEDLVATPVTVSTNEINVGYTTGDCDLHPDGDDLRPTRQLVDRCAGAGFADLARNGARLRRRGSAPPPQGPLLTIAALPPILPGAALGPRHFFRGLFYANRSARPPSPHRGEGFRFQADKSLLRSETRATGASAR